MRRTPTDGALACTGSGGEPHRKTLNPTPKRTPMRGIVGWVGLLMRAAGWRAAHDETLFIQVLGRTSSESSLNDQTFK